MTNDVVKRALVLERARLGGAIVIVSVIELVLLVSNPGDRLLPMLLALQVVPIYALAYVFGALR